MTKLCDCPLCFASDAYHFVKSSKRNFISCPECGLIFVTPSEHVSLKEEKERYSLHNNSDTDRGYVNFLKGIADEVENIGLKDPEILDFGSGKEAVLSSLLKQRGYRCTPYDPLYNFGQGFEKKKYNIIVMCETAEHLRDPSEEFRRINKVLKSGGYLLIRTELFSGEVNDFLKWWYIQDKTHICFYNNDTMKKIAKMIDSVIISVKDANMVLLRKR